MSAARVRSRLVRVGLLGKVKQACLASHVEDRRVLGRDTSRSVSRARAAIWSWLYRDVGLSYPEIGELWERDPKSVRAAVLNLRAGAALEGRGEAGA